MHEQIKEPIISQVDFSIRPWIVHEGGTNTPVALGNCSRLLPLPHPILTSFSHLLDQLGFTGFQFPDSRCQSFVSDSDFALVFAAVHLCGRWYCDLAQLFHYSQTKETLFKPGTPLKRGFDHRTYFFLHYVPKAHIGGCSTLLLQYPVC